jgi:hypothetical protein
MSGMFALFTQTLVTLVIGHPTTFQCADIGVHAGWWDEPNNTIYYSPAMCTAIRQNPLHHVIDFAEAALVFTHEAEHAAGIAGEHEANCAAVAVLPRVLKRVKVGNAASVVKWARRIAEAMDPPYGGAC